MKPPPPTQEAQTRNYAHRWCRPVCAGTTGARRRRRGVEREHPRMRGDHMASSRSSSSSEGTSPHARGPRIVGRPYSMAIGNIPACAGTTPLRASRTSWRREHPRMRGDHPATLSIWTLATGTSPHARGPLEARPHELEHQGNIPACAGTTIPGRIRPDGA